MNGDLDTLGGLGEDSKQKVLDRINEFGNNVVQSAKMGDIEVVDAGDVEVVKIGKDVIISMPKDKDTFMVKGFPFRNEPDQIKRLGQVV